MREGEHVVKVAKGNRKDAEELIKYTQPFEASALSGREGGGSAGYLPDPWRRLFWLDDSAGRVLYTVYSYGTPIAWLHEGPSGYRTWTVPNVKYSRTTSLHQGVVRRAIGD